MIARVTTVDVRVEGTRVIVLHGGQLLFDLEWKAALALAKVLHIQAKKAEANDSVEQIVRDQAILIGAGIPIRLSSSPMIQEEARKRVCR